MSQPFDLPLPQKLRNMAAEADNEGRFLRAGYMREAADRIEFLERSLEERSRAEA